MSRAHLDSDSDSACGTLAMHTPVGIFLMDTERHLLFVNERWCEIVQMSAKAAIGLGWINAVHPEDRDAVLADLDAVMAVADGADDAAPELLKDFRYRRPDGSPRWVQLRLVGVRDASKATVQYIGTVVDLTDRLVVEESLVRAKEAAETAARSKNMFLAKMSHEIRTPMNGVIGMTELALQTELTPEQREYISTARDSAESLLTIVNDILDFSKIEASRMQLDRVDFSVRRVVSRAMKALLLRAKDKGLALTCEVPEDVPDAVQGDPVRLQQVLVNLLSNAVKFTEVGEVTLLVEAVACVEHGVSIEFRVRDTGIGISAEQQAAIFEAFTQGDGAIDRRFGGTGLGLTISSLLVHMMGGVVAVQSEVGRGSDFYFMLTLAHAEREVPFEPEAGTRLDAPSCAHVNRSLTILVAEDNVINRRLATRLLEKAGHSVIAVENGKLALAAVAEARFDCVLLDIQMPEMDGLTATSAIRAYESLRGGHVPIIALTAQAMSGDRERCLEAGMDAYIAKPIDGVVMLETIYQVIGVEAAPVTAAAPAIDETDLKSRLGGDEMLVSEVVGMFIHEGPTMLDALRREVLRGDPIAIERAAHKVKGALLGLAAERASSVAKRMELQAREGDVSGAPALFIELEREVVGVYGALSDLLPKLDPALAGSATL